MPEALFHIAKMDCPTEEQLIRNRLKSFEGIDALEFDLLSRRLTVRHQLDDVSPILKALEAVGMDPRVISDPSKLEDHGPVLPIRDRWLMAMSGVLAIGSEVLALATGAEDTWGVVAAALVSIALGGRETIRKGVLAVRTLTLNINFLMTLAVLGAVLIGQWPEAAMVTFLFGVAEMVESLSLDRARHAIRSLMEMTPDRALVRDEDGNWAEVVASQVRVGQIVRVRPGERVPLDGRVISGSSSVNQAPITGESMPLMKGPGDAVFAATVNEKGSFEFEVEASSTDSTVARIIRAVQLAQSQRAPTQRFVDQFARYYTPSVVVLAVLLAVVPPLLFSEAFQPWLYKALVLLVIACPCALVISTPVTVVSALAFAARRGILVKGGAFIEGGRRLTVLALDKTGTMTLGTPSVTDIVAIGAESPEEILRLSASVDALSEHPVAAAVVTAAAEQAIGTLPVTEFESITGRGVMGKVNGTQYYLGNHRLAHERGYCDDHVESVLDRLESEGKTVVVLGSEQRAIGIIAVADTLRETSIEAIQDLHDLGIRTVMLTGDNERTAQVIAAAVGIDDARGNLLPEDKLAIVEELAATFGPVGMVGDGINDAPALAKASIGFAMGAAGSDTAIETADVALMQDDLQKIPEFIRLSRRTGRVLTQNIAFAISVKVVFFGLALFGLATLWMAVFADMGASLLVVGNGLRLLKAERAAPARSTRN